MGVTRWTRAGCVVDSGWGGMEGGGRGRVLQGGGRGRGQRQRGRERFKTRQGGRKGGDVTARGSEARGGREGEGEREFGGLGQVGDAGHGDAWAGWQQREIGRERKARLRRAIEGWSHGHGEEAGMMRREATAHRRMAHDGCVPGHTAMPRRAHRQHHPQDTAGRWVAPTCRARGMPCGPKLGEEGAREEGGGWGRKEGRRGRKGQGVAGGT